jgi:hypothetical protein
MRAEQVTQEINPALQTRFAATLATESDQTIVFTRDR